MSAQHLALDGKHLEHRAPLALFDRNLPFRELLTPEELRACYAATRRLYVWNERAAMWLRLFRAP